MSANTQIDIRQVVLDQMQKVAEHQKKKLMPLTDDLLILESGFDSLCVAILVANLEDELGVDPFGSGDDVVLPVTLGDLVRVYENAMQ
jgi:acyl carrier protein